MEKTSFVSSISCHPMNSAYFLKKRMEAQGQNSSLDNQERIHELEPFSLSSWIIEKLGSFFSSPNKEITK